MPIRVLIVEDEADIAEIISVNLHNAGMEHVICSDALEAQNEVDRILPDIALVDWMLPGRNGLSLLRQWRQDERTRNLPVIMLTARADEQDKVSGLDAGADDYIVKPFSIQEMLARIRALLRRKSPEHSDKSVTENNLFVDPLHHSVSYKGKSIYIGPTEFRLLNLLIRHPGRIFTRNQLLDRIWGDHVFIKERTVDVHIKRLREALESEQCGYLIGTVRGIGYKFETEEKF